MDYQPISYLAPDFETEQYQQAPFAAMATVVEDGVAPVGYHATSNYPEYVKTKKGWLLAPEARMDGVLVLDLGGKGLRVVEARVLKKGELVILGRSENGEEGILVHVHGFTGPAAGGGKFSFRTRDTRETPFSRSYDELYELLRYEKQHGYIVWVLGPAVAFDRDSRAAMQGLIENGYCHGLMAGNALATHDLEAGFFGTGLGQDIYSQKLHENGHYHHLDIINQVRQAGSIKAGIEALEVKDGIMFACINNQIPYVLAGSIRDDGPLPGVVANVYEAQAKMRVHAGRATTVIAVATQLHSIAFGNMLPSYRVEADGSIRSVQLYIVDMAEFSVNKLANRGSAQAKAILTNGQDFVVNLWNNLSSPSLRQSDEKNT